MKSKEEILKNRGSLYRVQGMSFYPEESCLVAMSEFAQQEAIEFLRYYIDCDITFSEAHSIEDVYNLFKEMEGKK